MEDAISGHWRIVTGQIRALGGRITDPDYDDMISDGQLALWQGISTFDPSRGRAIDHQLAIFVKHRLIDGIRRRNGRKARPKPLPIDHADELPAADTDRSEQLDTAGRALAMVAAIDDRLPGICIDLAAGYSLAEIALRNSMTKNEVRDLLDAIPGRPLEHRPVHNLPGMTRKAS